MYILVFILLFYYRLLCLQVDGSLPPLPDTFELLVFMLGDIRGMGDCSSDPDSTVFDLADSVCTIKYYRMDSNLQSVLTASNSTPCRTLILRKYLNHSCSHSFTLPLLLFDAHEGRSECSQVCLLLSYNYATVTHSFLINVSLDSERFAIFNELL